MADRSAIEWTDATWNPVRARHWQLAADGSSVKEWIGHHCEHVSEGCRNCYAERFNLWRGTGFAYKPDYRKRASVGGLPRTQGDVEVFLDEAALLDPLRWRKPRKIFLGSMTDVFADFVTDEMLDRMFAVMALCPQHVFQVLTKRPERMRAYLSAMPWPARERWRKAAASIFSEAGKDVTRAIAEIDTNMARLPLPNVWLGTSAEDQSTADARIPHLLATPVAIRFVSAEPLLGPIDFWSIDLQGGIHEVYPLGRNEDRWPLPRLDWIIVGGESGPHARPMHPKWAREIRDQCAAAGVPFFFKQHGEWVGLRDPDGGEWPTDAGSLIRLTYSGERHDGGWPMQRVGKKLAGRLLDGVAHDGAPAP